MGFKNRRTRELEAYDKALLDDSERGGIIGDIEQRGSNILSNLSSSSSKGGMFGGAAGTLGLLGLMALTGGTAAPWMLALAAGAGTYAGSKTADGSQDEELQDLADLDVGRNRDLIGTGDETGAEIEKDVETKNIKNAMTAAAMAYMGGQLKGAGTDISPTEAMGIDDAVQSAVKGKGGDIFSVLETVEKAKQPTSLLGKGIDFVKYGSKKGTGGGLMDWFGKTAIPGSGSVSLVPGEDSMWRQVPVTDPLENSFEGYQDWARQFDMTDKMNPQPKFTGLDFNEMNEQISNLAPKVGEPIGAPQYHYAPQDSFNRGFDYKINQIPKFNELKTNLIDTWQLGDNFDIKRYDYAKDQGFLGGFDIWKELDEGGFLQDKFRFTGE